MDPTLIAFLVALGLPAGATQDATKTFALALSAQRRKAVAAAELAAKFKELTGEDPVAAAAAVVTTIEPAKDDPDPDAEFLSVEVRRSTNIRKLAGVYGLDEAWALSQIAANADMKKAQTNALATLAKKAKPEGGAVIDGNEGNAGAGAGDDGTRINVGVDKTRAMLLAAIPDAILLRGNANRPAFYLEDGRGRVERDEKGNPITRKPHAEAAKFRSLTLLGMFRHYLHAIGVTDAHYLSAPRLAELLSPREFRKSYPAIALAQSTSDFANVLIDAINKSFRMAYLDAPTTWNVWARRVVNDDFKNINRIALSEVPDLTARNQGHGVDYGIVTDSKEVYALGEFTNGIKLTRQAIINDDMNAFSRIPMLQGKAAKRKEDDVAYAIITANANLADGVALFSSAATRLNFKTPGAAPTVAELAATEKLLMKQKGPAAAARLELRPRFLLVPSSIYRTTQQVVTSTVDPAKNNAAMNPFFNEGIVIVPSTRLDDNSAVIWYLLASYDDVDTVEVCFLTDEPEPVLKQETDFDTDDLKLVVRHTVAAKAIDFRGMVKNAGA